MKRRTEQAAELVVDYSDATPHAISWLGDRYLPARPINASGDSWHKAQLAILQALPADRLVAVPRRTRH
jgi:hypothetical protein